MRNGFGSLTSGVVDTNGFIYAYDPTDRDKQERAKGLIRSLAVQKGLIVTTQVLNEFYVRATRPNRPPSLTHEEAAEVVRDVAGSALVLPLTLDMTLRAVDAVARYHLAYWDAIIWAAAKESGVGVIYTEDVPGAPVIDGVQYINPFAV